MLVELITAYYLANTEPMYWRSAQCPCATMEVALHVRKEYLLNNMYGAKKKENGDDYIFFDAKPYVDRDIDSGETGRAGAFISIGYSWRDTIDVSLFHHSSHNLDSQIYYGEPIEQDGAQLTWRISK